MKSSPLSRSGESSSNATAESAKKVFSEGAKIHFRATRVERLRKEFVTMFSVAKYRGEEQERYSSQKNVYRRHSEYVYCSLIAFASEAELKIVLYRMGPCFQVLAIRPFLERFFAQSSS